MNQYRLIRGRHVEMQPTENGIGYKKVTYMARDREGNQQEGLPDVVESDKDLVKIHGPHKFIKVEGTPSQPAEESDGLEKMTVAQLKEVAEESEIELDDTMKKAEIIQAIRSAMEVA